MDSTGAIRDHLVHALDWEEARAGFEKVVTGIPVELRGARPPGFEHSPWQLLEHIRLAQEDILDFCVNANYEHTLTWPDDYWPKDPAPPSARAWSDSIASYKSSLDKLKQLTRAAENLTALVPTGKGSQTYLRAVLLVIDHTAYHVGQLVSVRKALGAWQS